jgi:hypothetical protein
LPFETQPERRTEATQSRNRPRRFRPNVIMVRSPSWAGKKTLLPRKLLKFAIDEPMLWLAIIARSHR